MTYKENSMTIEEKRDIELARLHRLVGMLEGLMKDYATWNANSTLQLIEKAILLLDSSPELYDDNEALLYKLFHTHADK
jgi:hypothetical protein